MKWLHFLCISLVAGLTGCVSIQSNVKHDAVPPFSRILVVAKMRHASPAYVDGYLRAFPPQYAVCTVFLNPLSFDNPDEAIRKQAENCNSDVILTIELTKTGVQGSRYSPNIPYEWNAEMRSLATGQPFWKALISTAPVVGEDIPPRSVVRRLLDDGIIQGKLPPSAPVAQNTY